MQVEAPAKINLTLRVVGKRPDGYHELESVMQMLTLADLLTIEDADTLEFTCSDPILQRDDNLVVRATRLLQRESSLPRGVHLHLEKRIPQQAGLGGGSSDAATTLAALNEFWDIRLPLDRLTELAGELGSDVSFFLNGPLAVVRGRGEAVRPVSQMHACYVVVAKPAAGLSTPRVYGELQASPLGARRDHDLPETTAMLKALQAGDPQRIADTLVNDLEGPALLLMPELFRLRERMLAQGCLGVLLCGSGSAVFGICGDAQTAQHAAIDLTNDCPWTWAGPWIVSN